MKAINSSHLQGRGVGRTILDSINRLEHSPLTLQVDVIDALLCLLITLAINADSDPR